MFGLAVFTGLIAAGVVIGVLRSRRSESNAPTTFQRSQLAKK
jgi:hypothetical protein